MTHLKKQAEQIMEFVALLEKVSMRIPVPAGTKTGKPFTPSIRSKPPAPPLPRKEDAVRQRVV